MNKADLHIHTTASDGLLKPEEVVNWAIKKKLKAIAITDHDTVSGVERAIEQSKQYQQLLLVPGIELSTEILGEEVHILGYFIDYKAKELTSLVDTLKESRVERGIKIVKKLKELDLDISFSELSSIAKKGVIGRPHIARLLVNKSYVKNVEEAFSKYLGNGRPAYVKRYKLMAREAIDLIHNVSGVAVLAHPGLLQNKDIIHEIIRNKIDGIEVVHSKHSKEDIARFKNLANKHNLITTGGSDCHGYFVNNEPIMGNFYTNFFEVEKLMHKAREYNV